MTNSIKANSPIFGIDFDNTLAIYDDVIHQSALDLGLIDSQVDRNKKQIRDTIRKRPGGEIEWQKLQGLVYGPRMSEARLAPGALNFFRECGHRNIKFYIISHKTRLANYDETRTNLREAAMSWMVSHGFFDAPDFDLSQDDVFMEDTRPTKLTRIFQLRCTHFIDDLEEIFLDPKFPVNVQGVLYTSIPHSKLSTNVNTASTWEEVRELIFANLNPPMPIEA